MTNIIEKQIFNLESAKVVLHCTLENILDVNFAELDCYLSQSNIIVKVNLFKMPKRNVKLSATEAIQKILGHFCNAIPHSIIYQVVEDEKAYPKYYYLLFYYKYVKAKVPVFTTLNKLENLKLPPTISGVYLRVKGKRGVRKDKKTYILGDVSKHSSVYGQLKKYKGTVETPMGTMGICVTIMLKNYRK